MSDSVDFKDVKRTPKARDGDLQEGRPHPALRVYGANYGEAVSYEEARDRMAARKKGELPIIKGGIDDNDPALEITDEGLPGPYQASHLSNKPRKQKPSKSQPQSQPKADPAPDQDGPNPGGVGRSAIEELMEKVRNMAPGSVGALVQDEPEPEQEQEPRKSRTKARRVDNSGMREVADALRQVVAGLVAMRSEAAPQVKTEAVNDNGSSVQPQRVRVEVATGQMTFNLPAIDYIRCAGGVAVMLPDSGDSMTFVPATGSPAILACQERSARDEVVFTGISFHLKAIGALCLVFSYDRQARQGPQGNQTPRKPQAAKPGPDTARDDDGRLSVLEAVMAG